jgi:putative transposase
MQRMGIEAIYRRPRTTKPEPGHNIYPYLLCGMEITRPNEVWAMDITYIPMAAWLRVSRCRARLGDPPGTVVAAVDPRWKRRSASRPWRMPWLVTAGRKSSTPTRARSSPARHSPACSPATPSPSAWTAEGFSGITSSSSGSGEASNTKRLYLRAYETVGEARNSIGRYLKFYNGRRAYSSLDGSIPDQAYLHSLPLRLEPNPAEALPIDAEILFRQPGPAH